MSLGRAAALLILCTSARAQPAPLGVNFSWWTNFHPEWVFVDAFKGASDWASQRRHGGPWNTGEPIARRADGYPAWLNHDQAVATIMFKDIDGRYPGGRYVVLWDGDGDLELRDDAREVSRSGNRIEADVSPRDGIQLRIVRTNPSNPVHNVRVIMPGFEATYQSEPFHPAFLATWRGFGVIRFMDWMRTNGNMQANWSERPTPDHFSQATELGVALEHMIDLCNEIDADAWFCLPHLATDDYARQFARTVAARLEPERGVYLEYSNECWNGSFEQAHYCQREGLRLQLSTSPFEAQLRFYSQRAVELLRIAHQELSPTHRLTRVLAGQNAGPWTGVAILDWRNASREVDAFAVAPYFGEELGHPSTQHLVSRWSVDRVLVECWHDLHSTFWATAVHSIQTQLRGLRLIGYEGGQHLVGFHGAENNTALTDLFIAANRHPAMYWLYTTYLQAWTAVGGGTMATYDSADTPSKWGSWGAIERSGQDPFTAPKYLALRMRLLGLRFGL